MPADLGFGITAAPRQHHAHLGAEVERLGYRSIWVNDTSHGDGLATLAEIAPGTRALSFGVGVIALSEHGPDAIATRLASVALPLDRLTLGIGSGSSASLGLVRAGVLELRRMLPEMPIAVAAVGPRMARLAGELADAVVANWALPERLGWIRDRVAEGAVDAGRPRPRLVGYVRTAIGPGAAERLRREMDRYAGYGAGHYRRAFADQGGGPVGVAVESGDANELAAALAPYRAQLDTLVIRGLPADDEAAGWLRIAEAAAEYDVAAQRR